MTAAAAFKLRYYRHGKIVLVRIEGPLIGHAASTLTRPLLGLFKKGVCDVAVDLTVATDLDVAGVEVLQEASEVLIGLGHPRLSVVVKPNSPPSRIFEKESDYKRNLRFFESTDEAHEALEAGKPSPARVEEMSEEDGLYLTVRRDDRGPVALYEIAGELDIDEVRRVKQRLLSDLDDGQQLLVLDLKGVDFIDSSALGLFATLRNRLEEVEGDIRFSRLSPSVRRVFEVFRLPSLFKVYDSIDEAVESFATKD